MLCTPFQMAYEGSLSGTLAPRLCVCKTAVIVFAHKNRQLALFDLRRLEQPGASDADIMRAIANELIAEAGVTPPVPVELLASFRGISSITDGDIDSAGMLWSQDGHLSVSVRASDRLERKRFTVLHELGHTFLDGFADRVQHRCNPGRGRDRIEALSDLAAAELLLPYQPFRADLAARTLDMAAAEELGDGYGASIEAAALRMVELADEPALLVSLRPQLKPSQTGDVEATPALRVTYSKATGRWPFVPRFKSVADDSAFGRAFEGEIVEEAGLLGAPFTMSGPVHISARRYGPRVLALIRKS